MDDLDHQLRLPDGLDAAVQFLAGNSRGFGHNRRRALISRRLKHVFLTKEQEKALVEAILDKLRQGDIDEQFMDQLRLCRHLDPDKTREAASSLLEADKEHVRRYAKRALQLGQRR